MPRNTPHGHVPHEAATPARAARDAFFALPARDQACIIEFLKTLQVLPEGSPRVMTEAPEAERG